jgi:NADH:ubiquinone oxidoreductase subunit C
LTEKLGVRHLSTITGQDLGDGIGLDYQFAEPHHIIAIRTVVPKTSLKIATCTPAIPGAILYEMEIHDMFGVTFQGNPWMDRKLLLPENYPLDMPPPLLKTTSSDKIRKAEGLEK